MRFDALTAGPADGELVLLLHGFPQTGVLLARRAQHARALPGIAPSHPASAATPRGRDPGGRRRLPRERALRRRPRDCGGARARRGSTSSGTTGAAASPGHSRVSIRRRWSSLTAVSTPHTAALRQALQGTKQRVRMAYIPILRLPRIAESLFDAGGGIVAESLLTATGLSPGTRASRRRRRCARSARPARSTGTARSAPSVGTPRRSSVPVLHIWGDHEPVFTREATELTAEHCTGDYHLLELEGGSHWIPDEHWDDVADVVLEHLAANPSRRRLSLAWAAIEVTGIAQRRSWESVGLPEVEQVRPGLWSVPGARCRTTRCATSSSTCSSWTTGVAVIDTGWSTEEAWTRARRRHGGGRLHAERTCRRSSSPTSIPDHYGLAGRLREASGAWIALHPADAALIPARYGTGVDRLCSRAWTHCSSTPAFPRRCARELTVASMGMREFVAAAEPDVLLEDRATVPLPGWDLTTLHTPGHSPGHVCFLDRRAPAALQRRPRAAADQPERGGARPAADQPARGFPRRAPARSATSTSTRCSPRTMAIPRPRRARRRAARASSPPAGRDRRGDQRRRPAPPAGTSRCGCAGRATGRRSSASCAARPSARRSPTWCSSRARGGRDATRSRPVHWYPVDGSLRPMPAVARPATRSR